MSLNRKGMPILQRKGSLAISDLSKKERLLQQNQNATRIFINNYIDKQLRPHQQQGESVVWNVKPRPAIPTKPTEMDKCKLFFTTWYQTIVNFLPFLQNLFHSFWDFIPLCIPLHFLIIGILYGRDKILYPSWWEMVPFIHILPNFFYYFSILTLDLIITSVILRDTSSISYRLTVFLTTLHSMFWLSNLLSYFYPREKEILEEKYSHRKDLFEDMANFYSESETIHEVKEAAFSSQTEEEQKYRF